MDVLKHNFMILKDCKSDFSIDYGIEVFPPRSFP